MIPIDGAMQILDSMVKSGATLHITSHPSQQHGQWWLAKLSGYSRGCLSATTMCGGETQEEAVRWLAWAVTLPPSVQVQL